MKHTIAVFVLVLAAGVGLAAQGGAGQNGDSPHPKDSPVGRYTIIGYYAWGETQIQGEFTLRPDGTWYDNFDKKPGAGRWSYDRAARLVRFDAGPYKGVKLEFRPDKSRHGVLMIHWPNLEPVWAYRETR